MGTKEKLKVHIEFCERNNEDMDATSWGMEEGVIISGNEAKTFLKLIEQSTSQKETIERLREVSEELLQLNNKYRPGKIYGYGLAKVMEGELQNIVSKAGQVLYDLDNTTESIDQ